MPTNIKVWGYQERHTIEKGLIAVVVNVNVEHYGDEFSHTVGHKVFFHPTDDGLELANHKIGGIPQGSDTDMQLMFKMPEQEPTVATDVADYRLHRDVYDKAVDWLRSEGYDVP